MGTACNAAPPATPPHPLYPKWPMESGNRSNLRLLDPLINFRKISFLIRSFLLLEPQKSKMAARGPQNGRRGLERGPILGYWVLPSTFANKFFDPRTPCILTNQRPQNPKWPTGSGKGSN